MTPGMIGQVHEQPRSGAGASAQEGTDPGTDTHAAGSSDRAGAAVGHRSFDVGPEDVDVVIAPEWLADLHDPTLVISHGYVGPDRRGAPRPDPLAGEAPGFWRRVLLVVLLTAVVVVPLTLIVARSVPPAAVVTPVAAPVRTAATPGGSTGSERRAARAATASARASARAATASARAATASARELTRLEVASARAAIASTRALARADAAHARADAAYARALSRADSRAARDARVGPIGSAHGHHPARGGRGAAAPRVAPTVTPAT